MCSTCRSTCTTAWHVQGCARPSPVDNMPRMEYCIFGTPKPRTWSEKFAMCVDGILGDSAGLTLLPHMSCHMSAPRPLRKSISVDKYRTQRAFSVDKHRANYRTKSILCWQISHQEHFLSTNIAPRAFSVDKYRTNYRTKSIFCCYMGRNCDYPGDWTDVKDRNTNICCWQISHQEHFLLSIIATITVSVMTNVARWLPVTSKQDHFHTTKDRAFPNDQKSRILQWQNIATQNLKVNWSRCAITTALDQSASPFREFWLQNSGSSVVVDPKWCNPWILPTNLQEVSRLWLQEYD